MFKVMEEIRKECSYGNRYFNNADYFIKNSRTMLPICIFAKT